MASHIDNGTPMTAVTIAGISGRRVKQAYTVATNMSNRKIMNAITM
jgi:hypothetical protein